MFTCQRKIYAIDSHNSTLLHMDVTEFRMGLFLQNWCTWSFSLLMLAPEYLYVAMHNGRSLLEHFQLLGDVWSWPNNNHPDEFHWKEQGCWETGHFHFITVTIRSTLPRSVAKFLLRSHDLDLVHTCWKESGVNWTVANYRWKTTS